MVRENFCPQRDPRRAQHRKGLYIFVNNVAGGCLESNATPQPEDRSVQSRENAMLYPSKFRQSFVFFLLALGLFTASVVNSTAFAAGNEHPIFKRIMTQYIAALGDPQATSGNNAQDWGLWRVDPGPRGVRLKHYEQLQAAGGIAPAQWMFDSSDWWLEENGLIMEPPEFGMPPGKYIVTGNREVTTLLTVHAPDAEGNQRWALADGASLYDVTHLGCRSGRYRPASSDATCSPADAPQSAFRLAPGEVMPPVAGCSMQEYAVLFIVAVEDDS